MKNRESTVGQVCNLLSFISPLFISPLFISPLFASPLFASLFFAGLFFWESPAAAQTPPSQTPSPQIQLWHQPPPRSSNDSVWLPQPILQTSGEVVEFTAEAIKLQSPKAELGEPTSRAEDDVTAIAADRIVWIEPAWSDPRARQGMEHFEAGRYEEALPQLLEAIKARPPVWQQQWLTGHLAIAAAESGRYPAALELVGQLARSHPPTPVLSLLPIRWTARPMDASAVAAARTGLDAAEPAVRLVAASWMLGSAGDRAAAERTLLGLSNDTQNPWIARFAEAVRWRRTPVPQIESAADGWLEKIDQLPISLQGGPLLCAADRLAAAGFNERASELYLAVAMLHQHPRPLADEARENSE